MDQPHHRARVLADGLERELLDALRRGRRPCAPAAATLVHRAQALLVAREVGGDVARDARGASRTAAATRSSAQARSARRRTDRRYTSTQRRRPRRGTARTRARAPRRRAAGRRPAPARAGRPCVMSAVAEAWRPARGMNASAVEPAGLLERVDQRRCRWPRAALRAAASSSAVERSAARRSRAAFTAGSRRARRSGRYMSTTMPPMTTPITAISSGSNRRVNQSTQRASLLVVEGGDALHHLAHVAGALAHAQHAQRHRRGQPVRLHGAATSAGLRGCAARRAVEARAQLRRRAGPTTMSSAGDDRDAAAQQHAQRAVEARQLVDPHALADGRDAPQRARDALHAARPACSQQHQQRRAARRARAASIAPCASTSSPHCISRRDSHGRSPPDVLVDAGEARHHVAEQEQRDQPADARSASPDRSRRSPPSCAPRRAAVLVGDVARTAPRAGRRCARWRAPSRRRAAGSALGKRSSAVRQRPALEQRGRARRPARLPGSARVSFSTSVSIASTSERPGLEQRQQFLAEEAAAESRDAHGRANPPRTRARPRREDGEPLRARLLARGGLVGRVDREADDAFGALDGADFVLHRQCCSAPREGRLDSPLRRVGEGVLRQKVTGVQGGGTEGRLTIL